jgi:hypothetical protein
MLRKARTDVILFTLLMVILTGGYGAVVFSVDHQHSTCVPGLVLLSSIPMLSLVRLVEVAQRYRRLLREAKNTQAFEQTIIGLTEEAAVDPPPKPVEVVPEPKEVQQQARWKKGQRVKCVEAGPGNVNLITTGKEYVVVSGNEDPRNGSGCVVKDDSGVEHWFYYSRFVAAVEELPVEASQQVTSIPAEDNSSNQAPVVEAQPSLLEPKNWKKGQKLRCVDPGENAHITVGREYLVAADDSICSFGDVDNISVIDDMSHATYYNANRFVAVEESLQTVQAEQASVTPSTNQLPDVRTLKKGQKVKCIDDNDQSHTITKGKIYTLTEHGTQFIYVLNNSGNSAGYFYSRFEAVVEEVSVPVPAPVVPAEVPQKQAQQAAVAPNTNQLTLDCPYLEERDRR